MAGQRDPPPVPGPFHHLALSPLAKHRFRTPAGTSLLPAATVDIVPPKRNDRERRPNLAYARLDVAERHADRRVGAADQ